MTNAIDRINAINAAATASAAPAAAPAPASTKAPSLKEVATSGTTEDLITRLATKANADRVSKLAENRVAAAEKIIAEERAFIAKIDAVRELLPEGAPSAGAALSAKVGDAVQAKRRSKSGEVIVSGVVVAVKPAEGASLPQYRIQIGEGFDQELINVFPGQLVEVKSAGTGEEVTEPAQDAGLAALGL